MFDPAEQDLFNPVDITGDWLVDMSLWYILTDPYDDEEESEY